MRTSIAAVILAVLLGYCTLPSYESSPSLYGFSGKHGYVHTAHLQPNGDLLMAVSGFIDPDYRSDQSVIRVAPDGEIIWTYSIPYMSEIGGASLFEISDGRYVASAVDMSNDQHIYFFDAEEGLLHISAPIRGGWLFPMDDYILCVDGSRENVTRLRWITLDGVEEKYFDYTFHEHIANPFIAKSENGFIMMTTFFNESDFMLTKIRNDGSIEWQNSYETPLDIVNYFVSDLQGGVFIMSDPGLYATEINVMRVDKEGNRQWDTRVALEGTYVYGMDVNEQGYRIQKVGEGTIQLGAVGYDGTVVWEAKRSYPAAAYPDSIYSIDRMLMGHDGTEYAYGQASKKDYSEDYGLFFLPLDAFPFAAEKEGVEALEGASGGFNVYDKEKMRTEIIAHLPNGAEDVNYAFNTVRLTTYYFGSFVAQLPADVSLDDIHTHEHVKVVLVRPEKAFSDGYHSPDIEFAYAKSIEGVPVMNGKLLEQTNEYMDISIWTYERNSEREGETQRFLFTDDSVFSRYVSIGEDVKVTYETDDGGNLIALLVTGFSG